MNRASHIMTLKFPGVLFLSVFMVAMFWRGISWAETYRVAIRQIDPEGTFHMALCDERNRLCSLTIPLVSENGKEKAGDPVEIGILFEKGGVSFLFKQDGRYLHTSRDRRSRFFLYADRDGLKRHEKIMLYVPHPLESRDPEHTLVYRAAAERVAALEIFVEPDGL